MRVRFEEIGGVPTRYYDAGEGLPLLLLHGVGMTSEVWARNIPALAERYRVIAPDLLGCGFTESGNYKEGPVHPHVLEHLKSLIEKLGLQQFVAVGSSFGALIAALLHLNIPERVPAIVMVSSGSAFNDDDDLRTMYQATWKNGRSAYLEPTFDNCVRRLKSVLGPESPVPEGLVFAQMISYALPRALATFDSRMSAMVDIESWRPWRLDERLGNISADVLAIFGRHDPRANLERARIGVAQIPRSRFVVFETSRHYPQIENPEQFNALVSSFALEFGR